MYEEEKEMSKRFLKAIAICLIIAVMSVTGELKGMENVYAEGEGISVWVTVENTTYAKASGAAWEGTLFKTQVELKGSDNACTAVVRASDINGYGTSGAEFGYFTEIGGLKSTSTGGWLGAINDWYTPESFSSYTVENGGLKDGDEIIMRYSLNWGEDIGSIWSSNSTALKNISFSKGELSKAFNKDIKNYDILIENDREIIRILPEAENKNFQVRMYLNEYTPEINGSEIKRKSDINIKSGDKIFVGIGNDSWPSMNYGQEETVYTFLVKNKNGNSSSVNGENESGDIKDNEENNTDNIISDKENDNVSDEKYIPEKLDEIFNDTTKYLLDGGIPTVSEVNGEWIIIGLAGNGNVSEGFRNGYYKNVCEYVLEHESDKISSSKASGNARVILALTALGYDVSNVEGYNLLQPLSDFEYVTNQGITGAIWTLIALDSREYEVPQIKTNGTQVTREALIRYILDSQLKDGGFGLDGKTSDTDITAMALCALAKYYNDSAEVKTAVNNGMKFVNSQEYHTAESVAQVIMAYSMYENADGIEIDYKKNGLLEELFSFYLGNGSFAHLKGGQANQMATEQSYLAMISYKRMADGKSGIFEMKELDYNENSLSSPDTGDRFDYIGMLVLISGMLFSISLISGKKKQNEI